MNKDTLLAFSLIGISLLTNILLVILFFNYIY